MAVELDVVDVGTMAYGECWQLQQRLFDEAIAAKAKGERPAQRMLLVEHACVYAREKRAREQSFGCGDVLK